jgi:multicomponent Na+:H+ antiporter subunit C
VILIGIYALLIKENLIKKMIGLVISVNGIHLLLISLGYKTAGIPPIITTLNYHYFSQHAVDPLPQALVLTSIVINLSITALALVLIVRAHRKFATLNAKKLRVMCG